MPKSDPDYAMFARRLEGCRSKEGGSSFQTTEFDDILVALTANFPFSDEVHATERESIVRKGMFAAGATTPINALELKVQLRKAADDHLRTRPTAFVLAASFPVRGMETWHRAKVDGRQVLFSRALPRSFKRPNVERRGDPGIHVDDSGMMVARIGVTSRSIAAAYACGMESLDCLRGIWNLELNGRVFRMWSSDENMPLNKVLSGPVQTLHGEDGKLATDAYWYDPFYKRPSPFYRIRAGQLGSLRRETNRHLAATASGTLGDQLRTVFVRYCRACDYRDPDQALMKLWSLLEFMTASGNMTHEHTVKRVLALFDDIELEMPVLNFLRESRNRSAHAGVATITRENLVRLHWYVVCLIRFAVRASRVFRDLHEVGEFLALPRDVGVLRAKQALIARAIRFRGLGFS